MAKYEHFNGFIFEESIRGNEFTSTVQCFHFFSPTALLLEHFQPWLASSGSHFNTLL